MKSKHKRQVEQNPKCEHSKWRQKKPLHGIEITFDCLAQVLLPSLIWCVTLFHLFGVSHFSLIWCVTLSVGITRAVTCRHSLKRVTALECEVAICAPSFTSVCPPTTRMHIPATPSQKWRNAIPWKRKELSEIHWCHNGRKFKNVLQIYSGKEI